MVTFFNLSFTFFFEHFLQGTMDLMYRLYRIVLFSVFNLIYIYLPSFLSSF